MYIVYGLISALLAAFAFMGESALVRKANFNRISGVQYFIPSTFINAIIITILLLIKPDQFWIQLTWITVIGLLAIGLIDTVYNVSYIKALETSPASEVSPIVAINPLVTLMFTTVLVGLTSNILIILGVVCLVVGGIYLLKIDTTSLSLKNLAVPFQGKAAKLALLSATCLGLSSIIISYLLKQHHTSEVVLLLVRQLTMGLVAQSIFRVSFFPKQYHKSHWLGILFGIEALYIGEWVFRVLTISQGNVVLAVTVASIAPLFVLWFDRILFKEKITLLKLIGTILIITGVILISIIKF